MAECNGEGIGNLVCDIGNNIGGAVGDVVKGAVLSPMAKEFMDSFDSFLKDFMTSWLGPGLVVDLDGLSVNWFKTSVNSITVTLMIVGLMIAGIRIMVDNRSAPFKEAAKSFFQVIFVVTASTVLINALILGGDAYSKWILEESGTGVDQYGLQTMTLLANPGLALIVGIVGLFAVLIQWLIMLGRNATLPLLIAFWPTAAAANLISPKSGVFEKVTGWILAFIIYKPLAASIYAFAWKLKAGDDGIAGVLNGVVLIVLAIMTMPALLRLMAPVTASLGNASGGSMAATAGAALVAAGVAAGAMVATGGASAAASGGGAATKAVGKTAATTASTTASAGGGSATGGPAASGGGPSPSGSPAPGGGGPASGSDPVAPATGESAGGGSPASTSPGTSPASGSTAQTPSGASPATGSTPGAAPASGSASPAGGGGAAPASGSNAAGGGAPTPGAAPAGAPPASGARTAGTGTRAAARIAEAGTQAARGINDQATRDGRD